MWAPALTVSLDLDSTQKVTWARWETVREEDVNTKGRMVKKVWKKGSLKETIDELERDVDPLALHLFNKKWQGAQFRNLTSTKLPYGYC